MKFKLEKKYLNSSKTVVYLFFSSDINVNFKPGQFFIFKGEVNGNLLARSYSTASSFELFKSQGLIGFIVKKASEFGMSKYLVDIMKIGEEIEVKGPFGHMYDKESYKKYLFMSMGSGLSPIYGIYSSLIESGNYDKIVNIYGERYHKYMIPEVEKTMLINNEKIKNILYLSREENLPNGYEKGYIQGGIDRAVEFLGTENVQIFICGKPEMTDEVEDILINKGFSKNNMVIEKF